MLSPANGVSRAYAPSTMRRPMLFVTSHDHMLWTRKTGRTLRKEVSHGPPFHNLTASLLPSSELNMEIVLKSRLCSNTKESGQSRLWLKLYKIPWNLLTIRSKENPRALSNANETNSRAGCSLWDERQIICLQGMKVRTHRGGFETDVENAFVRSYFDGFKPSSAGIHTTAWLA